MHSSKSKDRATNKPTRNGLRRRGHSISAARKNPTSHTPNNGTKTHDLARLGILPKTTPQAKAEGKRKRRTSGKNGPSRKRGKSASTNGLNECLGKAPRLRGHEPDFEIPTLQGAVHLVPPPSILVDVLKHGGKYVPFPTLHPFVARSSKMLRKEVDDLERVPIWSTHFVSKKTQVTSKRPSLLEFPYKKLFASTGSRPSYTIKQSLGHKFHVIQSSLNELCDKMRIAMCHCLQCDPSYRGFHVPYSRLENYLEHNLVVEADRDSSLVLMSRACICARHN